MRRRDLYPALNLVGFLFSLFWFHPNNTINNRQSSVLILWFFLVLNNLMERDLFLLWNEMLKKDIINSGAKVVDKGNTETNSFYFEYTLENVKGWVELSGKKIGNYYNLQAELDERGKKETK